MLGGPDHSGNSDHNTPSEPPGPAEWAYRVAAYAANTSTITSTPDEPRVSAEPVSADEVLHRVHGCVLPQHQVVMRAAAGDGESDVMARRSPPDLHGRLVAERWVAGGRHPLACGPLGTPPRAGSSVAATEGAPRKLHRAGAAAHQVAGTDRRASPRRVTRSSRGTCDTEPRACTTRSGIRS
jgi:hypothetical protein